MQIEHLTTGSVNPPVSKGLLRLYSMKFCPFSQRVHLVLDAKDIPHDVVFINLSMKPEWYVEMIPTTKVPAVIVDNVDLYESLIVAEFLDEKFPGVKLHSTDPIKKAKDKILIESFGKVTNTVYKLYHLEAIDKILFEEFLSTLEPFEQELGHRGKYFGGNSVGMVDLMIWPWFERFPLLAVLIGPEFVMPQEKFPNISAWCKLMVEEKAVKKNYLTPEQHAHHFKMRRAGIADYQVI